MKTGTDAIFTTEGPYSIYRIQEQTLFRTVPSAACLICSNISVIGFSTCICLNESTFSKSYLCLRFINFKVDFLHGCAGLNVLYIPNTPE